MRRASFRRKLLAAAWSDRSGAKIVRRESFEHAHGKTDDRVRVTVEASDEGGCASLVSVAPSLVVRLPAGPRMCISQRSGPTRLYECASPSGWELRGCTNAHLPAVGSCA